MGGRAKGTTKTKEEKIKGAKVRKGLPFFGGSNVTTHRYRWEGSQVEAGNV